MTIRQGQVLAEFAAMVSRPGKTITETRDLITEMDRKLKLIRDLTHEGVSDVHARSVLIGLLDPMTRQHTAYKQGEAFESFRNAVLEFTNAASLAGTVSKSDRRRWEAFTCHQQNPAVALTQRTTGLFLEDKSATIVVEEDTTSESLGTRVAMIGVRKEDNLAQKANLLEKDLLEVVGHVEGVTSPMSARKDKAKARQ